MRGLYVLAAVAFSLSLLSLISVVVVYQLVVRQSEMSQQISDLNAKVTGLGEELARVLAELRILRANMSQQSQRIVIVQQNLTSPELVYEKVKDSVAMIKARVLVETVFGQRYASSQGSGFVYDAAGYIVTNYHVVEGAVDVEVFFPDKTAYKAAIIGVDPYADIAVLKIDPGDKVLYPLELANSSLLRVGQPVIAIGNPYGFEATLTTGVVSQLGRCVISPGMRLIPSVIQFDAAVNPGSSGGPLLDYSGKVIGITTAIYAQTGEFSGIGFAIPSNIAAKVAESLMRTGKYQHPWMGIDGVDVNMEVARLMNLPEARGFLITGVASNSPAERAGLRAGASAATISEGSICGFTVYSNERIYVGGDVILAVDGLKIFGIADLLAYLEEHKKPGDQITLTIYRDGQLLNLSLTLGAFPP
ncbi:MAG: trypsin-like peptidase domain-containing protein [Candidatus Bathyarchaeia archaeon]